MRPCFRSGRGCGQARSGAWGPKVPDGQNAVIDQQIADALGLLCRNGDNTDFDLVAAADLTEPDRCMMGLPLLEVPMIASFSSNAATILRPYSAKPEYPSSARPKLARADQNGIVLYCRSPKTVRYRQPKPHDYSRSSGGRRRKRAQDPCAPAPRPYEARRKRRGGDIDAAAVRHTFQIGKIGRQALSVARDISFSMKPLPLLISI